MWAACLKPNMGMEFSMLTVGAGVYDYDPDDCRFNLAVGEAANWKVELQPLTEAAYDDLYKPVSEGDEYEVRCHFPELII